MDCFTLTASALICLLKHHPGLNFVRDLNNGQIQARHRKHLRARIGCQREERIVTVALTGINCRGQAQQHIGRHRERSGTDRRGAMGIHFHLRVAMARSCPEEDIDITVRIAPAPGESERLRTVICCSAYCGLIGPVKNWRYIETGAESGNIRPAGRCDNIRSGQVRSRAGTILARVGRRQCEW